MFFSSIMNDSLLSAPPSPGNSSPATEMACFSVHPNIFIFNSFSFTKILLFLPLCIFILHHGLHQWWQHGSSSSAVTSHFDSFTYHLVTMETISITGCFLNLWATSAGQPAVLHVGLVLVTFTFFGEVLFNDLTCLERHLAVVHPVAYVSLREARWLRGRNICIGCVWLVCAAMTVLLLVDATSAFFSVNFYLLVASLTGVSFCSVSVLCALIHPGPGERGGARERPDQSKLRAFCTILAILGVLTMSFVWDLVWSALFITKGKVSCVFMVCGYWFGLPCGLVLPLLFVLAKTKTKTKRIYCHCCSC